MILPLTEKQMSRFWKKVDVKGKQECWEWRGALSQRGYGHVCIDKKDLKAHRVSYAIANGDPGEFFVCHKCDNPKCVNPCHLFLGTHDDNMRDAWTKNRLTGGKPNRHLSDEDKQIAVEMFTSGKTVRQISTTLRVHRQTIQRVILRELGVSDTFKSGPQFRKCVEAVLIK